MCDSTKPGGDYVFVQTLRSWDVHVQSEYIENPTVIAAVGTDPDDALTDCESRSNYFPNGGDRVVRIIERADRHPIRPVKSSSAAAR